MIENLVKIASRLDSLGLTKEADIIDKMIEKLAQDDSDTFEKQELNSGEDSGFDPKKRSARPSKRDIAYVATYHLFKNKDEREEAAEQIRQLATDQSMEDDLIEQYSAWTKEDLGDLYEFIKEPDAGSSVVSQNPTRRKFCNYAGLVADY